MAVSLRLSQGLVSKQEQQIFCVITKFRLDKTGKKLPQAQSEIKAFKSGIKIGTNLQSKLIEEEEEDKVVEKERCVSVCIFPLSF